MGLFPDTHICGLNMRQGCRERFPRHYLYRKPPVSDPGMHHGTCVTRVPWCMSESLTHAGWENVPGIPGACINRNFAYLVRGPCMRRIWRLCYVLDIGQNWTNLVSSLVLWFVTVDGELAISAALLPMWVGASHSFLSTEICHNLQIYWYLIYFPYSIWAHIRKPLN